MPKLNDPLNCEKMQNKRNEGTGDMASKDASFKSYVVAKCGITALNMETMTLSRRLARSLPVSQLNRTHDLSPACRVQIGILRRKLLAGGPETPRIRCEGALPVRLTDAKTAAAGGDTSYAATGAASLKASREAPFAWYVSAEQRRSRWT